MILKDEVYRLMLSACPSFRKTFDENALQQESPYLVSGEFAHHLLTLHQEGEVREFPTVARFFEDLHSQGDAYVKELATIGFLEGIQNVWGNRQADPETFAVFLGPISAAYWKSLNDFWMKKAPYVGHGIDR